jgi:energy-coupling factor transporter ATP-binding protein EcfA2
MSRAETARAHEASAKTLMSMFWHERDVTTIEEKLKARPLLVLGGRGLGKTTVLKAVSGVFKKLGIEPLLIDGRNTIQARATIQQIRDPQKCVLIDDLDEIFAPSKESPDLTQLEDALWTLRLNQSKHPSSRFLATASVNPVGPSLRRLGRGGDSYSRLTQNVEKYRLDPWIRNWKQRWREMFDNEFRRLLKDRALRDMWHTKILELSGGHPSLFGPAVEQLAKLCAQSSQEEKTFDVRLVDPKTPVDPELATNIRQYVEDFIVRNALGPIASSIKRLRDSSLPNEVRAFEELLEMTRQNPEGCKPPSEVFVRCLLIDDGLVYQDKMNGKFVIPGTLIREQITSAGLSLKTLVTASPDPIRPQAGEIAVKSGARELRIALSGAPWRVFYALYSQEGEVLDRAELEELAVSEDLPSTGPDVRKKAVRNAVQRLNQKLKNSGASRFISIRNEYDKGYRLILITN